jgi:hypothetical protein
MAREGIPIKMIATQSNRGEHGISMGFSQVRV